MPATAFLSHSSRVPQRERVTIKILAAAAVLIIAFAAGKAAAATGGPQLPSSTIPVVSLPSAGGVGISRPPDQVVGQPRQAT